MMLFGLVSCVFWVPLLAVAVLCCVVLWRSLTSAGVTQPECGGCGYAVADIPGTTCPECGRSLLSVGVATRSLVGRHRSSMLQAQLAWIGAWGGLSVILSWVVLWVWMMSGFGATMAGGGAVAVSGTLTPTGSATHGPVAVDVSGTGWGQSSTVALTIIDADGIAHEIELDGTVEPLSATVWSDDIEVWSNSSVMIAPALDEWFAAAGIDDSTDPDTQSRQDLDQYVTLVSMSPMFADDAMNAGLQWSSLNVTSATGTMGQMTNTFAPGSGGMVASAVALLVIVGGYIIGVIWIVRRRSKLMRLV